ncbi:hypothetical protein AN958_06100 [Leucoagaricus sp. SymC.cos]|nr:hypothetical protein AN958_06100 [Leucoagaricus sp. SymC.cos]
MTGARPIPDALRRGSEVNEEAVVVNRFDAGPGQGSESPQSYDLSWVGIPQGLALGVRRERPVSEREFS